MPNIELLEKSMPVAPIRIAALAGCRELAEEVGKIHAGCTYPYCSSWMQRTCRRS